MRTVGQDDQLTQRGANPRTGLITPFVTSCGSQGSTESDYVAAKPAERRHRSHGRWKQDHTGWSLTDSPLPSPAVQSAENRLYDRFVVDMPGVDDPEPPQMTMRQIKDYQEGVESMEQQAVINPNSSSIESAPPSTTRREVSTSASPRRHLPTDRTSKPNGSRRHLRAHILKDSNENPFLGGVQTAKNLNQYLSSISLDHSASSTVPLHSYRRPKSLSPAGSQDLKSQQDEPTAVAASRSRPKVHRQAGAIKVPRVRQSLLHGDPIIGTTRKPHEPNTVAIDDATDKGAGTELARVRSKLQPSQMCQCSRCKHAKAHSRDPIPTSRVADGNIIRDSGLEANDGQREAEASCHVGLETVGKTLKEEIEKHHASKMVDGQPEPKPTMSSLTTSSDRTIHLIRSRSFVQRVEKFTTLLETMRAPNLALAKRLTMKELQRIISTFRSTGPALRVLKRGGIGAETAWEAVKTVLFAAVYFLALLKIVVTLIRVLGLVWDILVILSWPARVIGVILKWCLLG